jgi:hypothetical protein
MAGNYICEEVRSALGCFVCNLPLPKNRQGPQTNRVCSPECRAIKGRETAKARAASFRFERPAVCEDCRRDFTSKGSARLCRPCVARRSHVIRSANAMARKQAICWQCGEDFTKGSLSAKQLAAGHIQKFCSKSCAARWRTTKTTQGIVSVGVYRSPCLDCGKWRTAKTKRIAERCQSCTSHHNAVLGRLPVDRPCKDCGKPVGVAAKHRCTACAAIASRQAMLKAKKARVASGQRAAVRLARKLKVRAVTVEYVNPIKVMERDKWRCQLCGVSTPKRLRGSYEDRAPELDHIIPIGSGGEHSYRNTQCACRKCNLMKSATPRGQMRLFG